jgi:baculoviral IAP repeat-containing protein 6
MTDARQKISNMDHKFSNPSAEKHYKKWMKWASKNKHDTIKLVGFEKNKLEFNLNGVSFYVSYPDDYPNSESILLVESKEFFPWINKTLSYCMRKSPNIYNLLKYIQKETNTLSQNEAVEEDLLDDIDFSKFEDEEELLEEFDIEEMKYEKKLKDNIDGMKGTLEKDVNSNATRLFNGNTPGLILINMLMNCRKKYNKGRRIKIELVDENVFRWKITFHKESFKNKNLINKLTNVKSLYGYDDIQMEFMFHDTLFPAYPPFLKVVRPRMENSMMHRISNLKMVHYNYWSPARSVEYIVDKLTDILDKHTSVIAESEMNDAEKYPNGAYHQLEGVLVKFASLCDVNDEFEELDSTNYPSAHKVVAKSEPVKSITGRYKSKVTHGKGIWAKGTGYGYEGSSTWNIDEYVQLQEKRDAEIRQTLQQVINALMEVNSAVDAVIVYKIIESSYLIPYIKTLFKGTTMVEMDKHLPLYKIIFTLLQFIITENSVFLFDDKNGKKNLFAIIQELYNDAKTAQQIVSTGGDNFTGEDDISLMVMSLFEMLHACYVMYIENKPDSDKDDDNKVDEGECENKEVKTESQLIRDNYSNEMSKHKFGIADFASDPKQFHYMVLPTTNRNILKAIAKECSTFNKSLPIHFDSSVFVRVDKANSRCIRVMITGPDNTPYDSGAFLFDVYAQDAYPKSNPLMQFKNHGGIRFNPNLYANGKVCLSLLGTWGGSESEKWNSKTSTMTQLFVSVQSQILIPSPICNEPGHERFFGTDKGNIDNKNYNNYIRQYTMQHSMIGVIEAAQNGKYPGLKDAIIKHFKLKKDYILNKCQTWTDEAFSSTRGIQNNGKMDKKLYQKTFDKLKVILGNL